MKDLFGNEFLERALPPAPGEARRRPTKPGGYAAPPGSGPAGQTCSSCVHYVVVGRRGRFRKCELLRAALTHGPGTDILARSPACSQWQPSR